MLNGDGSHCAKEIVYNEYRPTVYPLFIKYRIALGRAVQFNTPAN